MLRVLRSCRVFRLFRRIKPLYRIVAALTNAISGVAYAFVILLLVTSIYALIGVEFFSTTGDGGVFYLQGSSDNVTLGTTDSMGLDSLPFCFGDEYFGTYVKALFTLFQVSVRRRVSLRRREGRRAARAWGSSRTPRRGCDSL